MTVICKASEIDLEVSGKRRNVYYHRVPQARSIDDVLSPDYFGMAMSSNMLTVGDIIMVEAEDFSWFGELQVMAQEKSSNQCVTFQNRELKYRDDATFPKGFEAVWVGGSEAYVLHKNKEAIKGEGGFRTMEAAAVRAHVLADKERAASAARSATAKAQHRKPAKAEEKANEAA